MPALAAGAYVACLGTLDKQRLSLTALACSLQRCRKSADINARGSNMMTQKASTLKFNGWTVIVGHFQMEGRHAASTTSGRTVRGTLFRSAGLGVLPSHIAKCPLGESFARHSKNAGSPFQACCLRCFVAQLDLCCSCCSACDGRGPVVVSPRAALLNGTVTVGTHAAQPTGGC